MVNNFIVRNGAYDLVAGTGSDFGGVRIDNVTAARAEFYCEEALYKYEPRVEELQVRAGPNADEPNRLDIQITYRITGQTNVRNLVYPFYLRKPDEPAP